MVELKEVNSSNISRVGYDETNGDLQVEFKSGSKYVYHGVLKSVYESLLKAPSIGKFVNAEIKPHYFFEKLGK